MHELDDKAQQLRSRGYRGHTPHSHHHRGQPRPQRRGLPLSSDPNSPPTDPNYPLAGYMSDGSETSMSAHSTQSERLMRPRMMMHEQYQNSLDPAPDEEMELMGEQDGTMSDSAVGTTVVRASRPKSSGAANGMMMMTQEEKRKKSIMTRLIPGKQQANAGQ